MGWTRLQPKEVGVALPPSPLMSGNNGHVPFSVWVIGPSRRFGLNLTLAILYIKMCSNPDIGTKIGRVFPKIPLDHLQQMSLGKSHAHS